MDKIPFDYSLLKPRHWVSWLAIACLRVIASLPFRAKIIAGSLLGQFSYYLIPRRRRIVETNLSLCFPELTRAKKTKFVKSIFRENGIGFFEIAWAWWASPNSFANRFDIEGLEHLQAAQAGNRGVLLIGGHHTQLDLAGLMLNSVIEIDTIYRRNNDPVFEYVITNGRKRVFKNVLERSDMRKIVRKLREGRIIWYAPDQDHGTKNSVFAPFFGVQAATVTGGSKLLKLGQAKAAFVSHYRDPRTNRYKIVLRPAPASFPSSNEYQDASVINKMIEKGIRQQPAQYMWVHRRFKTRPDGEPLFYQRPNQ